MDLGYHRVVELCSCFPVSYFIVIIVIIDSHCYCYLVVLCFLVGQSFRDDLIYVYNRTSTTNPASTQLLQQMLRTELMLVLITIIVGTPSKSASRTALRHCGRDRLSGPIANAGCSTSALAPLLLIPSLQHARLSLDPLLHGTAARSRS